MADSQIQRSPFLLDLHHDDIKSAYERALVASSLDGDSCRICSMGLNKDGFTNKPMLISDTEVIMINVEKGYPKIKILGKMMFVHHLAFMFNNLKTRKTQVFRERWLNPAFDISHLCGKPRCMSCLAMERHFYQVTRDACHMLNNMADCPHVPPCKKRNV